MEPLSQGGETVYLTIHFSIRAAIMPFGLIGNALFILISGYFMVQKGKSIDLVKISRKLLMQLGFAAVGLLFATS